MPAPITTTLLAVAAITLAASVIAGVILACIALLFELILMILADASNGLG